MTQRQIKCNYCDNGQDILYDRDATPKTVNLDGTRHYHVKYGGSQQQQQQQPRQETVTISQSETKPVVTKDEQFQIKQAVKEEAIAQAHKENMEESAKLRVSIDNQRATLDDVSTQLYNLNKTLSIGFDLLRTWLDSKQDQEQEQDDDHQQI